MGLVVSVTVNDATPHPTTDNFLVRLFDDAGRPSGDLSCLALRQLPDGGGPKPPWILLDSPTGSLERSYAALLASKAAIVQKNRQRVVEHAGHCEFVFLIGPAAKQGALLFGENRPDVARLPVGSWLVDTQHGPMGNERLSGMLAGFAYGGATSMVRVGGYADRAGIQQSLDMGADGVLVPYINTADEARAAVSCCRYPTAGTRSVYFPQRSMNKGGLLGYAGAANDNVIVALQVETASCIKHIDEIAAVPGVDLLFLGQNDLCMSMGLYEQYTFPDMYTSPELDDATSKLIAAVRKNDVILGIFLFGTARVAEFQAKGFRFVSVGNDLHHILTQAGAYVKDVEGLSAEGTTAWKRRWSALI
jgi:4-hydroxy-2-oxoheptanedioate aldolase